MTKMCYYYRKMQNSPSVGGFATRPPMCSGGFGICPQIPSLWQLGTFRLQTPNNPLPHW